MMPVKLLQYSNDTYLYIRKPKPITNTNQPMIDSIVINDDICNEQ